MVWVKLNDTYGDDCARLSDAAFRTHTEGLGWTMRRLTEGRISERDLRRFAETADPDAAVAELLKNGWWETCPDGDGWVVVHDMDVQRSPDQVEADRSASAERQRRWREAHMRKPRPKPDEPAGEPVRDDVERLCAHLADRVESNGSPRPAIGKRWRDAARLLLDNDEHTEAQVHRAIDWCQDHPWWCSRVLAMPKLREQYNAMRLQAEEGRRHTGNGKADMRGGARQDVLSAGEAAAVDEGSIV